MLKFSLPDVTPGTYFLAVYLDILSSKNFMHAVYFSVVGHINFRPADLIHLEGLGSFTIVWGIQILFSGVLICFREHASIQNHREWCRHPFSQPLSGVLQGLVTATSVERHLTHFLGKGRVMLFIKAERGKNGKTDKSPPMKP